MKEENLNNNVSNDTNETISRLKEKYKERREYSIGYLDFVKNLKYTGDFNNLYLNNLNTAYQEYQKYLNVIYSREQKLKEIGI